MTQAALIFCGLLLAGCAAQTVNTPPPLSPMDECIQATKNNDTAGAAKNCSLVTRDRR
ncbi:hypothetical protein RHD99_05690 [Buttiauxella selenatireducens]|uniref:Lipoprotein n=1 Tax=Buttiauxella selenatireducens TaxID=3073902 RepID=A0ABY9SD80_9ENTR|nr:hypothetical protein [Buttiauxella sp. R73]WMY75449.1 hypothetical protein RHD99_05690 [Buttiauxella sp. R73]